MHAFRIGQTSYGVPSRDFPDDMENERNAHLGQLVAEGGRLIYEYDLGDGWEHEIKVEKALAPEPSVRYPRCLAGKRACPPEDCGGPYGYQKMIEVLRDPKHQEHAELLEWVGGRYDAEKFDLDDVNEGFQQIR